MRIAHGSIVSVRLALFAGCALVGARADAQHYTQANLVADEPGVAAIQDPNLVNPWGLARSSGSPWWSANNETGTATIYNVTTTPPTILGLVVTIPPADAQGGEPGHPTGTVFNGTPAFELNPGNPARFLFVTEDGTISGWNPAVDATHAVIKAKNEDAVYKGAAIASRRGQWFLYVANFSQGRIDVFDSSFHRITTSKNDDDDGEGHQHHRFQDHRVPRGFEPFNVQNIGGDLYVTFAKRDPATNDDVTGPGLGYVDVFSPSGRLLRRLEHGEWLNARGGWPSRRATSGPSATTCSSGSSAAARSRPTTSRPGRSAA
jgi:uncharacterized protein (TIGR03118 family)